MRKSRFGEEKMVLILREADREPEREVAVRLVCWHRCRFEPHADRRLRHGKRVAHGVRLGFGAFHPAHPKPGAWLKSASAPTGLNPKRISPRSQRVLISRLRTLLAFHFIAIRTPRVKAAWVVEIPANGVLARVLVAEAFGDFCFE